MYFSSCIDSCYKNLNSCQSHIHYFFIYFTRSNFGSPAHACIQQQPLPVFRVARNLVQKKRAQAYYPAKVPGALVEIGKREKIFHRMFRRGPLRFYKSLFSSIERNPITVQFIPPTIFFPFYHQHHYCLLWFHLLPCCRCLRRRCTCHPNRRRHRRPVSIV